MELVKTKLDIDFMGKRLLAASFSILLLVVCIGSLMTRGLNMGIDFTGGTLIELEYPEQAPLQDIRDILADSRFKNSSVQHFGSVGSVLIRVAPQEGLDSAKVSNEILTLLGESQDVELNRVEFVGPRVGEELVERGGLAMIYALIMIMIYIALRFQIRFSIGAIAALIHDVVITVGFFSITGYSFDLSVVAAILAVIGYSLNDTIVVFDRVRENFRKLHNRVPFEVINISLNQVLSRTIVTSMTTLLVLFALLFLGGEIIQGFSLALIVGILVGTYSSLYVANPVTLALGVSSQDLKTIEKENIDKPVL